jgi:hypothetical protein
LRIWSKKKPFSSLWDDYDDFCNNSANYDDFHDNPINNDHHHHPELTPTGAHSRVHLLLPPFGIPHGKSPGRGPAHLELFPTGLIDLPKP